MMFATFLAVEVSWTSNLKHAQSPYIALADAATTGLSVLYPGSKKTSVGRALPILQTDGEGGASEPGVNYYCWRPRELDGGACDDGDGFRQESAWPPGGVRGDGLGNRLRVASR
eukprot:scaffold180983_cov35-Prasinocladus_malaysianus.AAC.1